MSVSQSPRDMRAWVRNVERDLKDAKRAARTLVEKSPGGTVEGIEEVVQEANKLTPAAPVELEVQTSSNTLPGYNQTGNINVTFPEVTKASDGTDMTIDSYELWGKDTTLKVIEGTVAPYPGLTAPGLSFPGQDTYDGPDADPTWKRLDTAPIPNLTSSLPSMNSVWLVKARAIGAFAVAPGLWSEEVEVRITPDSTPPPQPSKPIVSVKLGSIAVRWDGFAVSGPMPIDFLRLHIAQGTSPAPEFIVRSFDRTENLFIIPDAPYYQPQFIRFRAEDTAGNLSAWSEQEVAVAVPLVDTSEMEEVIRDANEQMQGGLDRVELIALTAQASADGKTTNYYEKPLDESKLVVGDTWFDSLNGDRINRWDGENWVEVPLGEGAIKDLAITNAKILNLDGAKITAESIGTVQLKAQSITSDKLLVGSSGDLIDNAYFRSTEPGQPAVGWTADTGTRITTVTPDGYSKSEQNLLMELPAQSGTAGVFAPPERILSTTDTYHFSLRFKSDTHTHGDDAIFVRAECTLVNRDTVNVDAYYGQVVYPGAFIDFKGSIDVPEGTVFVRFSVHFKVYDEWGVKLRLDVFSVYASVDGTLITPGSITLTQLGDESVSSTKIVGGAITTNKIAANAITSAKIDALAITADKIAANAVTADHIEAGSVRAAILSADSVTAETIDADAITAKHTITAALYQSSPELNEGLKIDALGMKAWNASGQKTVDINGTDNLITGNFRSAPPGQQGVIIFNTTSTNRPGIWLTHDGSGSGDSAAILLSDLGSMNIRSRNGYSVIAQTQLFSVVARAFSGEANSPFQVWPNANGVGGNVYLGNNANDQIQVRGRGQFLAELDANNVTVLGRLLPHDIRHQNPPTSTFAANVGMADTPAGRFYKLSSARRYKYAIDEVEYSTAEKILNVPARSWFDAGNTDSYANFLEGGDTSLDEVAKLSRIPGVVAEEVEEAGLGMYCTYGPDGTIEGVSYDRLWTLLIPLVRNLREENKSLAERLEKLELS